jgi:hypothetical protein
MSNLHQMRAWKSKANAEYQKVIASIIALSTATLTLPTLFLKDFMGVAAGTSLRDEVGGTVVIGWISLFLSIGFCLTYYYASAKWLKKAYGGSVKWSERAIELCLDITYWAAGGSFMLGLLLLVVFIVTYVPKT